MGQRRRTARQGGSSWRRYSGEPVETMWSTGRKTSDTRVFLTSTRSSECSSWRREGGREGDQRCRCTARVSSSGGTGVWALEFGMRTREGGGDFKRPKGTLACGPHLGGGAGMHDGDSRVQLWHDGGGRWHVGPACWWLRADADCASWCWVELGCKETVHAHGGEKIRVKTRLQQLGSKQSHAKREKERMSREGFWNFKWRSNTWIQNQIWIQTNKNNASTWMQQT
jgi:hypothetical protein